jgi:anti-anti-sigma regulatory factor
MCDVAGGVAEVSLTKTCDEVALGDHVCVVLDSDEQHWEVAAEFVVGGLRRGEKIVYFDSARSTEPLLRRLREQNVDAARHLRTGRITMVPPPVTDRLWTMSVPEVLGLLGQTVGDALAEGYPSVRITDEPAGAAARPGGVSLAEYDTAVAEAMRGNPVTLLCQYERTDWSGEELRQLCEMHETELAAPSIYDDGLLRITRTAPFVTRVSGEIDFSNRHLVRGIIDKELDQALRTLRHNGEIEVHLESLRFADVTAIVQFLQAAEGFPQTHRLVLHGVQPVVRRVLERCGAAFTTQLALRDTAPGPDVPGADPRPPGLPRAGAAGR